MAKRSSADSKQQVSTRILVGLIIGAIIGGIFNSLSPGGVPTGWIEWSLNNVFDPIGQVFLRSLFMIVVPLVFASLTVGVANLGSAGHVGRLGGRVFVYYLATTLIAVVIGQILVSIIEPGAGLSPEYIAQARQGFSDQVSGLMEKSTGVAESLWPGLVSTIIPKNIPEAMASGNMLAIIFVAVLFGIALLSVAKEKTESTLRVLSAVSDASILVVGWIMKIAPIAVAALMIGAVARFGVEVMGNVAQYVAVVLLAYLCHFFGTYSLIVKFLLRLPLREFYRRAVPVFTTAFSTSSSNATIPMTMHTLEKRFGVPENITTFSVPLGATVNMDGTAMFEAVAAIFIAQVFGVEISLAGQVSLVILIILTSIGVAGVPGGSIPILMSAMATLGIPPEGIALVLGVDRLLDMGRTVVNVTGDMSAGLFLARVEGVNIDGYMAKNP